MMNGCTCIQTDAREHVELPPPVIWKVCLLFRCCFVLAAIAGWSNVSFLLLQPVRLWTGKQVFDMIIRPSADPKWPLLNVELKVPCPPLHFHELHRSFI